MTLIVDAGGLLSVFDGDQPDHELFLEAVQTAHDPLIVSPVVLAELDHFILGRLGRKAQLAALEEIEAAYKVERFTNEDLARSRALCARYADLTTFDLADASCVVLAERYECFDILTTDQRDFRAVAGRDGQYFRVLPYDR
ncbi:MAG: PIN domain-containing protein [Rubrobacteraceae bacterium]|nr:PIN domain-containing protein [Rubrobacteraceae bacterium]